MALALVRTYLENGGPDYHVAARWSWLVFDASLSVLYTLTGEESSGEPGPAARQVAPWRQPGRNASRRPGPASGWLA